MSILARQLKTMTLLNEILMLFQGCFTEPCLRTFVSVILGLIIRTDKRGMASLVRAVLLPDNAYDSFEYFFKSAAFDLKKVNETWIQIIKQLAPLRLCSGMIVFILDGVKNSKEGKKMVAVQKLHQESENSAKGTYIHGHMFGGVGVLIGHGKKLFCLPLSLKIHNGLKEAVKWSDELEKWREESHVVQMIHQTFENAKIFGKDSVVLADRYFPTVPAFKTIDTLNASVTNFKLHLVAKMKISTKAYEDAPQRTGKRGRPPVKGADVKLKELFSTKSSEFIETKAFLYGEEKTVRYYVTDLLWGSQYYKKLRFILVSYDNALSILVSTNLELTGKEILELYGYRFKIECTFRELKQVICGFGYRFWNKSMPKLNKFKKKGDPDPLEGITNKTDRKNILKTIRAIELFALCGCIALGSLQLCSLKYSETLDLKKIIYLRTYRGTFASEATMAEYIRRQFYCLLGQDADLAIIQKIKYKQSVGKDIQTQKNRKVA